MLILFHVFVLKTKQLFLSTYLFVSSCTVIFLSVKSHSKFPLMQSKTHTHSLSLLLILREQNRDGGKEKRERETEERKDDENNYQL